MSPRRVDTRWRRWRTRLLVVLLLAAGGWAAAVIGSAIIDGMTTLP